MITALAPGFLRFLPLALLPLVFHLFLRLRRQTHAFPSLQFFLATDPHLHARRRLREWLVLALRCGVLLFLVLALARPQWRGGRAAGDATLVWVVDNSASMAATDTQGRSRLERAVAVARALADDPRVRRAGLVVTVPDATAGLPDGLTTERAVWKAALDAIRPTHAAGRPEAAVARAAEWLAQSVAGPAELHVLTDAQSSEWERSAVAARLPAHVRLCVHRIGTAGDRFGDVALEALLPERRPATPRRAWRFEALVHNLAPEAREAVLHAAGDGSAEPVRIGLSLPPAGVARVPVALRAADGAVALRTRVWLEGAAASAAAVGWLATTVSAGYPVWLLGDAAAFGLLPAALAPDADGQLSGLRVEPMPPARALQRLREGGAAPLAIATTGAVFMEEALAAALRDYVARGGTLLAAPAAPGGSLALPAWCGVRPLEPRATPAGTPLVAAAPGHAVWEDLRDAAGHVRLPPLRAWHWAPLALAPPAEALLRTEAGDVVLAVTPLEAGHVVVSGLAWTTTASDLPRRAAFLALVQAVAGLGRVPTTVLRAGDPAGWRALLAGQAEDVPLRWQALAGATGQAEGRVGTLPPPARAGIYRVTVGTLPRDIAVIGEAREAEPRLVASDRRPYPAMSLAQVGAHAGADASAAWVARGRRGWPLYGPLLSLALLCALAETWLSQRVVPAAGRTHAT